MVFPKTRPPTRKAVCGRADDDGRVNLINMVSADKMMAYDTMTEGVGLPEVVDQGACLVSTPTARHPSSPPPAELGGWLVVTRGGYRRRFVSGRSFATLSSLDGKSA